MGYWLRGLSLSLRRQTLGHLLGGSVSALQGFTVRGAWLVWQEDTAEFQRHQNAFCAILLILYIQSEGFELPTG